MINGDLINYPNAITGAGSAIFGYGVGKEADKFTTNKIQQITGKPVQKGSKTEQFIQHGIEGSMGTLGATWSADWTNKQIEQWKKQQEKNK